MSALRGNRLLGGLLTLPFLLCWGLLLGGFHLLQVVALNLFGKPAHRRVVAALNFALVHCLWILGTRIRVQQAQALPTDRPIIFIANHQNKLDIPGISWYLRRHGPRFVAKIELAKGIPSISYNLRHSGAALIDRDDARQALGAIGRLGQLIEQTRTSAVIFPEGTRSPSGVMAPFQSGGVKVLMKKAPSALVVPIYIDGTWKLNRYGKFPMPFGETVSWSVLPAIEPAGMKPDEVVALAQSRIAAAMAAQPGR